MGLGFLLMGCPGRAQRLVCGPRLRRRYAKLEEHATRTSQKTLEPIATIGVDLGKNTFHLVGLDKRGAAEGIRWAARTPSRQWRHYVPGRRFRSLGSFESRSP
jgi:hypothetical protein